MSSHHPRPDLARQIADELTGANPLSDAPNGLFLAAPRRTGKTQFLRLDLKPELEQRNCLVLYADLWEDDGLTPMALLAAKIGAVIQANLGAISKFAKNIGLEKISVPAMLTIELSKIGKADGLTLHQALDMLYQATGKRMVLMVDEAQHALTTPEGDSVMRALKSARDQMKTATQANLLLVMAGSHQDKLMRLLDTPSAAFWGSKVRQLAPLGDDYVARTASLVRQQRPEWAAVRQSALVQAFEHFGRRPQFFFNAVTDGLHQATDGARFEQELLAYSQNQRTRDRESFTQDFVQLDAMQQAVLVRMLDEGENFKPFDAPALAFYARHLGGGAQPTTGQVQTALEGLRHQDLRLVWKSLRGEYAPYDQAMLDWHAYLIAAKQWPPVV